MRETGSAPTAVAPADHPGPTAMTPATPRHLWALAGLTIVLTTAARLPSVAAGVEEEVVTGPMAEVVEDLPDADLAVAIGTTTALVISIALKILVLTAAMAVERRTRRAGHVVVRGRHLSLAFLVVVSVLLSVQLIALVLGLQTPGVEPWSTVLALGLAVTAALTVRHARWRAPLRLALALLLAVVCLAV